jgi:hypothetical protein
MPDRPQPGGLAWLQALDAAARDARSVLRRAVKLADQVAVHQNPELERMALEAVEASERLVAGLEERRAQERQRLRSRLRSDLDQDAP